MVTKSHQLIKQIDGEWHTSKHVVDGHPCWIKMSKFKGCKIHIWNEDETKVLKTFRYNFSTVDYLLKKASEWLLKNT